MKQFSFRKLFSYRLPTGALQFAIFLLLAAIVLPVGINFIAGPEGFRNQITLRTELRDAVGLTAGTGVTLRGVDVGTVKSVDLLDNREGAVAELSLRSGTKIPADSYLMVTMASMAGIQSVDIISNANHGPYLQSGDTIAAPAEKQPKQMDAIISDAAKILNSIGDGQISTIGNELFNAFGTNQDSLTTALANGAILARLVNRNAPLLRGLFSEWLDIIDAMAASTGSFERGMSSAASFTSQLDSQQLVFIYLLDKSPAALTHAQELFDKYRGTFGGVLANLATVEPIISNRSHALATGLQTIPQGLIDLRSIVKNGRADFALIATQGPVCMFYNTPRSLIGDLTTVAPNLGRYCPPGNGYGQRGAANAPRPDNLGTSTWNSPGGVAGPPAVADPILIPNGAELLDWWRILLERARNGK